MSGIAMEQVVCTGTVDVPSQPPSLHSVASNQREVEAEAGPKKQATSVFGLCVSKFPLSETAHLQAGAVMHQFDSSADPASRS